ncbi:MAG: glycosyltransferase family 2 protein [Candidatus Melainabacteria bacterium]|nr:glycosyltransferase family 2 protein [Candidatus Melainabacteria bacterium]
MKLPISVIVLTFNEEKNIEACLKSVKDFVEEIFVVDSFSTDKTLGIVKKYTNNIFQHEFKNYGKQRNWALKNLPIKTRWVLNLDADHRCTNELKKEVAKLFASNEVNNWDGFLISRKTIFMGKWIKHGGHYPVYQPILFKLSHGSCEEHRYNQHLYVKGKVKKIKGDIEDIVSDDLASFTFRHNRWSTDDAIDQLLGEDQVNSKTGVKQNLFGNPMERRRFFRSIYMHMPLLVKPFIYFFYRYFIKLGFLDGKEGIIFHTLQGFWYQFLVDAKIYEQKIKR